LKIILENEEFRFDVIAAELQTNKTKCMVKKRVFLSLLAVSFATIIDAQETPSRLRLQISSFEIGSSGYFGGTHALTLEQLHYFANVPSFGVPDLSTFSRYSYWRDVANRGMNMAATFDFKRGNSSAFWGNPALRVGFSYHQGSVGFSQFQREERYAYDTLFYTYQGVTNALPIDSVAIQSHGFSVNSNRLRINAALIFRTNPERRWSFYAGVGLGLGLSLNSSVFLSSGSGYGLSPQVNDDYNYQWLMSGVNYSNTQYNYSYSSFRGRTIYDMTISIPLGVDFRIGNCDNIWRHVHLFGEIAPMLTLTKYSGVPSIFNLGYTGTLGIRIKF
jgi:hypothetical protein